MCCTGTSASRPRRWPARRGGCWRRAEPGRARQGGSHTCNDPRFDELRYSITDDLGALSDEFAPEATAETAALHIALARTNPNIAIATVAVHPDAVAAARHFITPGSIDLPCQVFSTMAEARAWIASRPPTDAPRPRQLKDD